MKDSFEVVKRDLAATKGKLTEVSSALVLSDSTVSKQDRLNVVNMLRINNYDNQVANLNRSNALVLDENISLKGQLKKEKRKTLVIGGVSIAVTASLLYLLIKK